MAQEHFVIVGNGPAANSAALTLRDKAPEARITILSRDIYGHYQPNLLPNFVAGKIAEDQLYVEPPEFYRDKNIKLRLGQEVVDTNFSAHEVMLAHKEVVRFDGLIIAVGGIPRIPEPLLVFEDLMLTLKTVTDAKTWIEKLKRVDSVLIVGGDLTSLAFTKALLSLGKQVSFILDEGAFWPIKFDNEVRVRISANLQKRGVEVIPCKKIRSIACVHEDLCDVETDAGRKEAGVVGAFFGLVPNVKFLARSGLAIERGILVDEYLKTPFDGVYAAGDCAQVYQPQLRDYWISIGYQNAENLGRIAALNLVGGYVSAEASLESIYTVKGITVNTSWWQEI